MTDETPRDQAAAIARWPNVPACYGWLSLDRRGRWRLKDETVSHPGLLAFLNQNYHGDDAGNWFVQNGPQRVYVALQYLPLVVRLEHDGTLRLHTDRPAGSARGVFLDEDGSVLMLTDAGPGLLDDRDLSAFLDACVGPDGSPATDEDLLAAMSGSTGLRWNGLPVERLTRTKVPAHFGFNPEPEPLP